MYLHYYFYFMIDLTLKEWLIPGPTNIPSLSTENKDLFLNISAWPEEKWEKVKRKQCFWKTTIVPYLENHELIPVWWSSLLHNTSDRFVETDFENQLFVDFFNKVSETEDHYIRDINAIERIESVCPNVNKQLILSLIAYTMNYQKFFQWNVLADFTSYKITQERKTAYRDNIPLLSDIFKKNLQQCVEQSILVQKYLQNRWFNSQIINWEVMWKYRKWDTNFGGPHSFILIDNNNKEYIYDPTNPISTNDGSIVPRISTWLPNKLMPIFTWNEKKYIKTKDVIWWIVSYYGSWNLTGVSDESVVDDYPSQI